MKIITHSGKEFDTIEEFEDYSIKRAQEKHPDAKILTPPKKDFQNGKD